MTNTSIISFTLMSAYKYGNILEQMLRLRHKGFIIEEKYDVRNYNNTFEFDQYDDPHAHYIAILKDGKMIACSRVRCTNTLYTVTNTSNNSTRTIANITYMAKDIWSDQISESHLISSPSHYEVTRVYTDSSLNRRDRMHAAMAILAATYGYMIFLDGTLTSFVTHASLINMTKKLGMHIMFSCSISIPNFESLQYVSIKLSNADFATILQNLHAKTLIDLTDFIKSHGITVETPPKSEEYIAA